MIIPIFFLFFVHPYTGVLLLTLILATSQKSQVAGVAIHKRLYRQGMTNQELVRKKTEVVLEQSKRQRRSTFSVLFEHQQIPLGAWFLMYLQLWVYTVITDQQEMCHTEFDLEN